MTTVLIAAVAADGAIGRNGDLAFHISADLKHFKELTMGHPVVMGRRTFESLPGGPLSGRLNIVLSASEGYSPAGVTVAPNLEKALEIASEADDTAFIIGGASVYARAMPLADRMELTRIDANCPDADTFFPAIGSEWQKAAEGPWTCDPRSGLRYRFEALVRN